MSEDATTTYGRNCPICGDSVETTVPDQVSDIASEGVRNEMYDHVQEEHSKREMSLYAIKSWILSAWIRIKTLNERNT